MTEPRVRVPTLFDEEWDSVIIATYGADLAFYERDLWRQINGAKNRMVFVDARQFQRRLLAAKSKRPLRYINHSYVLAPIRSAGDAHAKLILLLSEDRGLLAVGSGNLGLDGYASQGECFTTYRWSEEYPEHLHAFIAAKDFLEEVTNRQLVDEIVKPRLQQAWQEAPWVYGAVGKASSPVRYNLEQPLLDQFIDFIDGRSVRELVVHAPFYDHQCRALSELINRTQPQSLQILLQKRITSVDPSRLSQVLSEASSQVEVRAVQAPERGTFLHAKFIVARMNSSDICLQGSPNISTAALLQDGLTGNIEIANLLEGTPGAFDHLVSDLDVTADSVEVSSLGLSLAEGDGNSKEDDFAPQVRELSWVPPRLAGVFQGVVNSPLDLIVGESTADDVVWHFDDPRDGTTPFTAILGESEAAELDRVAAVIFVFDSNRRTAPAYPYHLNRLIALSSGQGRTELLRQAGNLDLDDEEIEQLLVQLDEVLIVDGKSLWRMLKRKEPEPAEDEEFVSLCYDDLDWDAIRSHPKLAQYRAWDQRGQTDTTGLGILLESIADRFRSEVRRRSGEEAVGGIEADTDCESLDSLGKTFNAEDEQTAESEQAEVEGRRINAQTRIRRQFRSFVNRFLTGLTDVEFTRLVGPSVIVPSYVVFNHLCWKLAQLDLIDRPFVVDAQIKLWKFFWGGAEGSGYFMTMSEAEQLKSIEILDAHSAEAVLFASVYQSYGIACELQDADVARLRDQWRLILTHDLGGVGKASVHDAATVSGVGPDPLPVADFIAGLAGLAEYTSDHEIIGAVAEIVGCRVNAVRRKSRMVRRRELGECFVDVFEISDPLIELDLSTTLRLFSELFRLLPNEQYLRVKHAQTERVAFADYELGYGLWYDPQADEESEFEPPGPSTYPWDGAVSQLRAFAA